MKRNLSLGLLLALALATNVWGEAAAVGAKETGLAAVYSGKLSGHRTASGQALDQSKLTAAHKTLPFGTQIKVTNLNNNRSVILRVNDRGPMQADRVLDISQAAATRLHMQKNEMRDVSVEVLSVGNGKTVKTKAD